MLRKLREYRERYGTGRTAIRLFTEALKHSGIYRQSRIVSLRPEDIRHDAIDAGDYCCRLLPAAGMTELARQMPDQLPSDLLAKACRRGDFCYVVLDGERLASFGWYGPESASLFGATLEFSDAFVYMYHGFTHPDYRGRRLHALGLVGALEAFRRKGKQAIVSTVNITNYASRLSIERLGFRYHGSVIQIGPTRFCLRFATRATRPYGIRFRRDE